MSTTQRDAIRYFCQQKGMTEEQLADEINKAFEQPTGEELLHVLNKGHEQGYRKATDNALIWLREKYYVENYFDNFDIDGSPIFNYGKFENDFIKAMEEENKESP